MLAQGPSLYLGDLLRADLALKTGLPRGESTRRRLLIAATDIVQKDGYAHLTVAAICKAAGFAHGTFYLHWSDRRAIASDIISDLMVAIRQHRPRSPDGTDFYERLVIGHRYYVAMYRQNSGLMLCQWQLADEIPGFSGIGASANRALADRVLRAAAREPYRLSEPADQQLVVVLSCIAMVDKLLHDVFTRELDLGMDEEALAHSISRTWFRALFAGEPEIANPNSPKNQ